MSSCLWKGEQWLIPLEKKVERHLSDGIKFDFQKRGGKKERKNNYYNLLISYNLLK